MIMCENLLKGYSFLELTEKRIKRKEEQIADLQNEHDLLLRQEFDFLSNNVSYPEFPNSAMDGLAKWFEMLRTGVGDDGKKLNKRKKCKERVCFDFVTEKLNEVFETDKIEIIGHLYEGYGMTAHEIQFLLGDHTWELRLPKVTKVGFDFFKNYGKEVFMLHLLYKDNEFCWSRAGKTFEASELKRIMEKKLSELEKDGKETQCKTSTDIPTTQTSS